MNNRVSKHCVLRGKYVQRWMIRDKVCTLTKYKSPSLHHVQCCCDKNWYKHAVECMNGTRMCAVYQKLGECVYLFMYHTTVYVIYFLNEQPFETR